MAVVGPRLATCVDVGGAEEDGLRALPYGGWSGGAAVVRALLDAGARVDVVGRRGCTALLMAGLGGSAAAVRGRARRRRGAPGHLAAVSAPRPWRGRVWVAAALCAWPSMGRRGRWQLGRSGRRRRRGSQAAVSRGGWRGRRGSPRAVQEHAFRNGAATRDAHHRSRCTHRFPAHNKKESTASTPRRTPTEPTPPPTPPPLLAHPPRSCAPAHIR